MVVARTGLLSIVCDKEGSVGEKAHLGWIYPGRKRKRNPLCSLELWLPRDLKPRARNSMTELVNGAIDTLRCSDIDVC